MPLNKPKLSVLIPVFNAEKYIGLAIKSVLIQTYTDLEILICDDGSTDRTYEIASSVSHPKVKIFKNESNQGKNKTVDFLMQQSSCDYVTIHDADDLSVPDRFSKQMQFLLANSEYALCGTNFISFLDNEKIIEKSNLQLEDAQIKEKIKEESQFHGPTIVFKRDILTKVGGLYRFFTRAEDIDFTMRVTQKFKVCNLPDHLYLYRHVSTSLTNSIKGYSLERLGHIKLLRYLHEEREHNNGIDVLMMGDKKKIKGLMESFTQEYKDDPTIALRRGVFRLLGMRMHSNAIRLAIIALSKEFSALNLKCVVYTLFASIKGYWFLFRIKEKIDLTFLQRDE